MDLRLLGRTGLAVTPIGLGLAAVGRPAYITSGREDDLGADRDVDALRRRSHDLLDAAYAAGIRYVDAARSYGLAESFLGSWLAARGRAVADVTVGSKWGYRYVGEWRLDASVHEIKDHSAAALDRQLAESRAILGPRLVLYQVHSATLDSGVLDDAAVLQRLIGLRAAGLAVGLTVSGPAQAATIRRALELRVDGVNPFGVVQATWNVLEPSAGPALAEAVAAGWGVMVKEALANGRLATVAEAPPAVARLARRAGFTPDALAIAAAMAQPWATVVLSGAASLAQLAANVRAVDVALDPDEVDELAASAEQADAYWAARSARPWT
jgi:aryl-alcohol dehydrogenase-like predicted oxidoreductase